MSKVIDFNIHIKISVRGLLAIVSALLAVISVFLMFAPAAVYKDYFGQSYSYSGVQMTFGYAETADTIFGQMRNQVFSFSFLNFLPYLLLFAGVVFNALTKVCRFSNIVSAVCYLIAGVLFSFVILFCNIPSVSVDYVEQVRAGLSLGGGAISAAVISIAAALVSVAAVLVDRK